ncbi:N-formylglutamate amidohydrolase [Sphingobium sp. SCG-1]|uniref:N-formylglutamate amidohydrolase n=1 Tax=Sphingobium sp. SCG-1 TaxID=2072936 RepID=UPI000CD69BC9|nr:N-formylglutamate amidohydrolase [Sphingobium sp. SCG-1]AUW57355.1 N-formylglutamate amidohydrolase [Sphingobium sp. SCG-1]
MTIISDTEGGLLGHYDAEPVKLYNVQGTSPFLLLGDHAGNAIPRALGTLGLSAEDRQRHIAWDIGVREVGERLADSLDAMFVHQHYSRLVIDCNRDPSHAEAIAEVSDGSAVPGNRALDGHARAQRVRDIHAPYHASVAAILRERAFAGRETILVSLHSFTPVMAGATRPWEIGLLYSDGDASFALALLAVLNDVPDIVVGDNAPYQMDETDYTVPLHAFSARLPYVEVEMRQDLISSAAGQERWSAILTQTLQDARLRRMAAAAC